MRNLRIAALAASLLGLTALSAQAGSFTTGNITNTTAVEAFSTDTNAATPCSGACNGTLYGSYWGQSIGSNFQTSTYAVNWTTSAGSYSGNSISFVFHNSFVNPTLVGGTDVYAADIFIKSGGGTTTAPAPSGYNYAIALGDTAAVDGGKAQGLYQVAANGYKTSQTVWDPLTGYVFGGEYAPASSCNGSGCSGGEASPTVLTAGTIQGGLGESVTDVSGVWTVTLTALNLAGLNELNTTFGSGFDLFWGTGDCSNGPLFGDLGPISFGSVPEPASLVVFGTALLGWRMTRRRKRAATA